MPSAQGYDGLESDASCEVVGLGRLHAWQVSRVRDVALVEKPSVPTPTEKVTLFRSLFRGREDVFPIRFVSKKTGKPGYAPACANKFVRGVCELPRIKCGECPNQAFLRTDDEAVLDHLRGRHVMGVYPLLEDETCGLLAADFDKASWKDDVSTRPASRPTRCSSTKDSSRTRTSGPSSRRSSGWRPPRLRRSHERPNAEAKSWGWGLLRHQTKTKTRRGCAFHRSGLAASLFQDRCRRRCARWSRNGYSSTRPACRRRCSMPSSGLPPSRTPSSTRSRACGSRRR